jgi:hypothetical protein
MANIADGEPQWLTYHSSIDMARAKITVSNPTPATLMFLS